MSPKDPPTPRLRCMHSGAEVPLGAYFEGSHGGTENDLAAPFEVVYDYDWHRDRDTLDAWAERPAGVWSFRELLPFPATADPVSLVEGGTPLVRLEHSGRGRIWIKDETRNPTGAFKDRFHSVSVSMARALGFPKVTAATTGNHGSSLAAYAAKAGLECLIFGDPGGPELQRRLIQLFGARLVVLADRGAHLAWLVRERGWYPSTGLTPMPVGTPYGVEGYKSIGYEIYFQLGRRMPSRVVVPVSGGDSIYGPWKGFRELERLGAAGPLPRMFAAQSSGCDPIVQAFRRRVRTVPVHPNPQTIALSIGDPTSGPHALQTLYDSNGGAEAVSDDALVEAMQALAGVGIAAEPSAAASLAVVLAQQAAGDVAADEDVVCVVTGTAVKWPDTLPLAFRRQELRDDRPETVRAWISSFDTDDAPVSGT